MEIQFEQKESKNSNKMSKNVRNKNRSNKFVGVRQRASGRWVAEIKDTTQKIRMWLGTFETAEEAARAYDEAACLLRGSNTRTNFVTHLQPSQNSPLASRIRSLLDNKRKSNIINKKNQESCVTSASAADCQHAGTTTSADTVNTAATTAITTTTFECDNYHNNYTMFDDVYKPDFSHFDLPWTEISTMFDDNICLSEFDRMKVERQISASLYAINGVQEYMDMESTNDLQPTFLWDLPPICPLPC